MLSLRRDDVTTTRTAVRITYFNPRLREGGDVNQKTYKSMKTNFNPRLREGGDAAVLAYAGVTGLISIHASVKEATDSWMHV